MSVKLYPPVINGVLPAFYLEYDTGGNIKKGGKIVIPFAMNGAVSETQFKGFSLRLRTASSGSYVLPPLFSNHYNVADGEVTFFLTAAHANALNEGQYYKLQIAYCASVTESGAGNDIGYYSTVGVAKCVSKPEVSIRNLVFENINAFNNEYYGLYDLENCIDRTEKVYSYEFKIYDQNDELYYTTGEKLHQSYYDVDYVSSLDRITINDFTSNEVFTIEYTVTTLNGLVLSSPKYKISSQYLVAPNGNIKILPEADVENGVIAIHFLGETDDNHSYYYTVNEEVLNNLETDEEGHPVKDNAGYTMIDKLNEVLRYQKDNEKLAYLRGHSVFKQYSFSKDAWYYTFLRNKPTGMTAINGKYYKNTDIEGFDDIPQEYLDTLDNYTLVLPGRDMLQSLTYSYVQNNFIDLSKKVVLDRSEHEKRYFGSYLLSRASDEDNYTTWFNIARIKMDDQIPSDFVIRDVTIEHGRKYKYALQQYNIWGLYSARLVSDIFEASFEDAFLYDGEKVLRIRYNPSIDSFKTTILEQKTDTIGGRYPFITRNGATYYKEFPLGGLLAQEIDQFNYFVDSPFGEGHRHATHDLEQYQNDTTFMNTHDFTDTVIALERNFKLNVLEWLNNGKPKLFKSPYEGNYIVRLMNVSLTPVKELGRMLHSFTSQAYEIAECSYDNLVALGFIKTSIPSDLIGLWKTYVLQDMPRDGDGNVIIDFENGVQSFTIQDLMPGDIIYLTFADQDEELPIMIGITGSYTYEGISNNLIRIRIPQPEDHELTGKIDAFYTGMRVTDFDSVMSMQLKTVVSQQYIGTSPWMQRLKYTYWDPNAPETRNLINDSQYKELQNYNFRTYLDQTVSSLGHGNYAPSQNFVKLVRSFDPGELLDRINLTINQGDKYKTELLNIEMLRFRQRPLIPVFVNNNENWNNQSLYVPGEYESLLVEKNYKNGIVTPTTGTPYSAPKLLCATSPLGYPHPIEELSEYEMVDPFCIYEVFAYNATLDDWVPMIGPAGYPYYDPHYRAWLMEDYDPTAKMGMTWVPVAYLETRIIGYCSNAQVRTIKNNCVSTQGKYWYQEDEKTRFNLSDELLAELSSEETEVYKTPLYGYTDASQALVEANRKHQANKIKYLNGEYIDKALNEKEMYDYILEECYYDPNSSKQQHYYQYITPQGKELIENNAYEFFEKANDDMYFAIGTSTIEPNTVYWVKKYDVKLNLSTEKVIEYNDIATMNSYHIGNGVVAEMTFQIRIIDYYTEVYDADVRAAKEAYLNAKQFYSELMRTYNIIAKANLEMTINHGFRELYNKMINGNKQGEGVTDADAASIYNALNKENSKAELELMSLYNITVINRAHINDIINLLLNLKKKYTDELNRAAAFDAAELYHYYELTNVQLIDEYYLLDSRDFTNSENIFHIIDTYKSVDNEDELTTFRFVSDNGNTYYYKVDKDAYINEYLAINTLANPDELTIIYKPTETDPSKKFMVIDKATLALSVMKIYELEKITEDLTVTYLDLLNDDEMEALQDTNEYLYSSLVKSEYDIIDRELYEEAEIRKILAKMRLDGSFAKLQSISDEVQRLNDQIEEKQTFVNNLKINYIDAYNKALNPNNGEVAAYNQKVYYDWTGRVLYDRFINYPELLTWFDEADKHKLKTAIINSINSVDKVVDDTLTEGIEIIKNWIYSAKELYQRIGGSLPEVQRYLQMIDDNTGDEQLDTVLEQRIMQTKGQIILGLYAMREAILRASEKINVNNLADSEIIEVTEELKDCVNKYNILYDELINTTGNTANQKKFKTEFRDVKDYADYLVDQYLDLYTSESSKLSNTGNSSINSRTFDEYNLSLLHTYYVDYMYLRANQLNQENIVSEITINIQTSEDNYSYIATLKGLAPYSITYGPGANSAIPEIPLAFWIDPFDEESIFYSDIQKWTNDIHSQSNNWMDADIYHERGEEKEDSPEQAMVIDIPFKEFIFNPLSERLVDDRFIGQYNNNREIFDAIPTVAQKNNVLAIYNILSKMVVSILNSAVGTDPELIADSIARTYIRPNTLNQNNLFFDRYQIIRPYQDSVRGEVWPSLAILQQRVLEAKEYLLNKYGEDYILPQLNIPLKDFEFKVGIDDQIGPEYHIPYSTPAQLLQQLQPADYATYDEYQAAIQRVTAASNYNIDTSGNTYDKPIDLKLNWYQPIMISDQTLTIITKILETSTDIDTKGIYYEYINVYLQQIQELLGILTEAETLQRLYQKQNDVYTAKWEKYDAEYTTNQEIYSKYTGTEAFNYYNLLNNSEATEEQKQKAVQGYKQAAQEAWWNFLNLLDARYSAEKERGMYV